MEPLFKKTNRNRGFTLIELLISMAILSIMMLMVIQFMSSTVMVNKKTKSNLKAQTEAKEVMSSISDNLMQANFVKVVPKSNDVYVMDKTTGSSRTKELPTGSSSVTFPTDMCLVPDDYGNYVRNTTTNPDERKVIIDMDTYELLDAKESNGAYPLSGDLEVAVHARSFRILKQGGDYLYVKPAYIYAEYVRTNSSGNDVLCNLIYRFAYDGDKLTGIYLYRSSEETDIGSQTPGRYNSAKIAVDSLTGSDGLLTKNASDFYLSADAEGNAFFVDALFKIKGYQYNSSDTINFRNSNVLTVRPQNAYKKVSTTTP